MHSLKEQEERLRFLLSRVDSEITKFQDTADALNNAENSLNSDIQKAGLETVPVNLMPHSESAQNLREEVKAHLLELNKMKNLLNSRLNTVIKEEELIETLKKKYGEKVSLKKHTSGEFEIEFGDESTESAFNQLKTSKKLMQQLRDSLKEITNKKD